MASPSQKCGLCSDKKFLPLYPVFVRHAEIAQLVEHNLAKVGVASSSLVFRSHARCKPVVQVLSSRFAIYTLSDGKGVAQGKGNL